jgi:ParB/RepB/Spo0J family partition protein
MRGLYTIADEAKGKKEGDIIRASLDLIDDNPHQSRLSYDEDEVAALAQNIFAKGLKSEVMVRARADRFELVFGHRRVRAYRHIVAKLATTPAEKATWAAIPAKLTTADDLAAHEDMVLENLARTDLNPMEHALAVAKLRDLHERAGTKLSRTELAARAGTDERGVKRLVELADAPEVIREAMLQGRQVELRDEHNQVVLGRDEKPRTKTVKLELSLAEELIRIYSFLRREQAQVVSAWKAEQAALPEGEQTGRLPAEPHDKASAALERLIGRVLSEGWSRKRLVDYKIRLKGGSAPGDSETSNDPQPGNTEVGQGDGSSKRLPRKVVTLDFAHPPAKGSAEAAELKQTINDFLQLLEG